MTVFTVFPPSRGDPQTFQGVALQQDLWNDFNFLTQYHLYVAVPEFTGRIGTVKILRRGQAAADGLQLEIGALTPLGDDFVSLGQDLDYYERLASLPEHLRQELLIGLKDAIAFPTHAETFADEKGWTTSILREIQWSGFRQDAAVLLQRDYNRVARLGLDISFHATGWEDALKLNFTAPNDFFLWGIQTLVYPIELRL